MRSKILIWIFVLAFISSAYAVSLDKEDYFLGDTVRIYLEKDYELSVLSLKTNEIYRFLGNVSGEVKFNPKHAGEYLLNVFEFGEPVEALRFSVLEPQLNDDQPQAAADNIITFKKSTYKVGEAVAIGLSISENYTVSIRQGQSIFNYFGEIEEEIKYIPREPGSHSVVVKDQLGSIVEEADFYVLAGEIHQQGGQEPRSQDPKGADADNELTPENQQENILVEDPFDKANNTVTALDKGILDEECENCTSPRIEQFLEKYEIPERKMLENKLYDRSKVFRINTLSVRDSRQRRIEPDIQLKHKLREESFTRGDNVVQGLYDVEINNIAGVRKVVLKDMNFSGNFEIGIEKVEKEFEIERKKTIESYAIDPTGIEFDSGTVTKVAVGTELWKCVEWDFAAQQCNGEWKKLKNIVPGKEYDITITAADPGFAETNLTIIDVQSYPEVGGTWQVRFDTYGIADLTISAYNTTWSDGFDQNKDLNFLSVTCGDNVMGYEWINNSVYIPAYNCSETSFETSRVLTTGKHTLLFTFGNHSAFANNYAVIDIEDFDSYADFDTTISGSNWTNSGTDDCDWQTDSGQTASGSTGPDSDNTLDTAAGVYMYIETSAEGAHGGITEYCAVNGEQAYLVSDVLDADKYKINVSFYYHMYGAAMGTLYFDVYDGAWNNIWSVSGQQHTGIADPYTRQAFDLSSYTGDIQLRIRGSSTGTYTGDMAIDDINITGEIRNERPTDPTDIECDGDTDCNITVSSSVVLNASGSTDANGDTLTYVLEATLVGIQQFAREIYDSLYDLGIIPDPFEDFADFETDFDTWSADGGTCTWTRNQDVTGSAGTGPGGNVGGAGFDHTLGTSSGWYVYVEASSSVCQGGDTQAVLTGSSFEAGTQSSNISFWYHMNGDSMGTLHLDVYNGTAWETDVWTAAGQQQPSENDPFWNAVVDLSSYSGTINTRFRYDSVTGWSADVAIDDLNITTVNVTTASSEANSTQVIYSDFGNDYISLNNLTFTIFVDSYSPAASVLQATSDPDLVLELYDGSGWVSLGSLNLDSTYTSDSLDTTDHSFSVVTENSAVLSAWINRSYQDIRVTGIDMDYYNASIFDEINYTKITVSFDGNGWTEIGNHTNLTTYSWDVSVLDDHTCVDLRTMVYDLEGMEHDPLSYTGYYTEGSCLNISAAPIMTIISIDGDTTETYTITDETPVVYANISRDSTCYLSSVDESFSDMVANGRQDCGFYVRNVAKACEYLTTLPMEDSTIYMACNSTNGIENSDSDNQDLDLDVLCDSHSDCPSTQYCTSVNQRCDNDLIPGYSCETIGYGSVPADEVCQTGGGSTSVCVNDSSYDYTGWYCAADSNDCVYNNNGNSYDLNYVLCNATDNNYKQCGAANTWGSLIECAEANDPANQTATASTHAGDYCGYYSSPQTCSSGDLDSGNFGCQGSPVDCGSFIYQGGGVCGSGLADCDAGCGAACDVDNSTAAVIVSDVCYYDKSCSAACSWSENSEMAPEFCINDFDGGACAYENRTDPSSVDTCYYSRTCQDTTGANLSDSSALRQDYCDFCNASGSFAGDYSPQPNVSCSSGCADTGIIYYDTGLTPLDRSDDCDAGSTALLSDTLASGDIWDGSNPAYCDDTECDLDCGTLTGVCNAGVCECSDTDYPSISLISPDDSTWSDENDVVFYFTASDFGSGLENCSLVLDGTVTNTTTSPSEINIMNFTYPLAEGRYNWSVTCFDDSPLNRQNTSEQIEFGVDTTIPRLTDPFISGTEFDVNDEICLSLDVVDTSIWWNTSFQYRRNIHIDNIGGATLNEFPAYLNISREPSMQADYDDLRFVNAQCGVAGTLLDYEIDYYDGNHVEVWINIPTLQTSGKDVCMYYGNSTVGNAENAAGVWDSNYVSVYHLTHTSGAAIDTIGNFHAEDGIDPDSNMDREGIVGGADYFDGSDYLGTNTEWNVDGAHTYCAWVKFLEEAEGTILEDGGQTDGTGLGITAEGELRYAECYNNVHIPLDSGSSQADDQWHYVCGGHTGATMFLYVDGQLINSTNQGDGLSGSGDARIGESTAANPVFDNTAALPVNATMDEIRVSGVARGPGWINQTYQLIMNQENLVEFGLEEDPASSLGSSSGISSVIATITRPGLGPAYLPLSDSQTSSCDSTNGDGVYSADYTLIFDGIYEWTEAAAEDNAGNSNSITPGLSWIVNVGGTMVSEMSYPVSAIEINESDYNYNFSQSCTVFCTNAGIDCENVTLYAQFDDRTGFSDITSGTTKLVNTVDNVNCGNLSIGPTPWWDSSWDYRQEIEVNHTAETVTEYQIMIRYDTQTPISSGTMNSDCSDLRVVDSDNNEMPFYIDEGPGIGCGVTDTLVWVQMPELIQDSSNKIYFYHNNSAAGSKSNISNVFSYSSQKDIYYVIGDYHTVSDYDIMSYTNSNLVTLNTESTTLDRGDIYTQYDVGDYSVGDYWSVKGPLAFGCTAVSCDSPVPISFAGTEFISFIDRGAGNKEWHVYAPFGDGTVTWYDAPSGGSYSSTPLKTLSVTQGTSYTVTDADGTDDYIFRINSSTPILLAFDQADADTTVFHPAAYDFYGISEDIGYAYSGSLRDLCEHNSACTQLTRNGPYREGLGSSSDGTGPASHVNSTQLIGHIMVADGDGSEAYFGLPEYELSTEYFTPVAWQYIAAAVTDGGTNSCTWTNASGSFSYTPAGSLSYPNPRKFYLGDGTASPANNYGDAGDLLQCSYPMFLAIEPNNDDEANLWSYKQARQYVWPEPVISIGISETETGLDLTNSTCTVVFNISSGADSGNNTWPVRCAATSGNSATAYTDEVNITINDHPVASFTYPAGGEWLTSVEELNASSSFDSDGTIAVYEFRIDNTSDFSSSSILCSSSEANCTFDTTAQTQCDDNTMTCFLQVAVTDDNGLTDSLNLSVGIDNTAPFVQLDLPLDFTNISESSFTLNATVSDLGIGEDTAVFEFRQNNSASWSTACIDNAITSNVAECLWTTTGLNETNSYEIRVYANDSYSQVSGYDTHYNITLDRSGPWISLDLPENESYTNESTLTFYYNSTDLLSEIVNCSLFINSQLNSTNYSVSETQTNNFTAIGMDEGAYNWQVYCYDSLDNQGSSGIKVLNIDRTGPASVLDEPDNFEFIQGSSFDVNASFTSIGAAADTAFFEYRNTNQGTWNPVCSSSVVSDAAQCIWDITALPDSTYYEIRVNANDTLGNNGSSDRHTNISIDNYGPAIELLAPSNLAKDGDGNVQFRFRVNDVSSGIHNCSLIINNTINDTIDTSIPEGSIIKFNVSNMTNGDYYWNITCFDDPAIQHQNTSITRTLTVDIRFIMNVNVTTNQSRYELGNQLTQDALITTNTTDYYNNTLDTAVDLDIIEGFAKKPWWNLSWDRRRPLNFIEYTGENHTDRVIELNLTGISGYIDSCDEIRIVDHETEKKGLQLDSSLVGGDDLSFCHLFFEADVSADESTSDRFYAYYNHSDAVPFDGGVTALNSSNITARDAVYTTTGTPYSNGFSAFEVATQNCAQGTCSAANSWTVGFDDATPADTQVDWYFNASGLGVNGSEIHNITVYAGGCWGGDSGANSCDGSDDAEFATGTSPQLRMFIYNGNGFDEIGNGYQITPGGNAGAGPGNNYRTYNMSKTSGFTNNHVNDSSKDIVIRFNVTGDTQGTAYDVMGIYDFIKLEVTYGQKQGNITSIETAELFVTRISGSTGIDGSWDYELDVSGFDISNYSAVSLAAKSMYFDTEGFSYFEVIADNTIPDVELNGPQNNTGSNSSVTFSFYVHDSLSTIRNCSLYIDDELEDEDDIIQEEFIQFFYPRIPSGGAHNWSVGCTDYYNNTGFSDTWIVIIEPPDLYVNNSYIMASNLTPKQGQNISLNATVFNEGGSNAWNITARFYQGHPDSGGIQIGQDHDFNLTDVAGGKNNITINTTWVTPGPGPFNIYVVLDPPLASNGSIEELYENNNIDNITINVPGWSYYYGNSSGTVTLENEDAQKKYYWNVTNGGNIFVVETGTDIDWLNLYALGRDINGIAQNDDFEEADAALNMTDFIDSVNNTFTKNSGPVFTDSIISYKRTITNVPMINSTNSSTFMTGILWDSSDLLRDDYNGTQDLLFVTQANLDKQGRYGVYDYEIKIPALLDEFKIKSGTVTFYAEVQ